MVHSTLGYFLTAFLTCAVVPSIALESDTPEQTAPLVLSDSGLYAFDKESHELRWHQLIGQQTSTPIQVDGLVVVSGSGGLYALDANSGEVVWQRKTEAQGFSVVLDEKRLLLASRDGRLQALNARDGDLIWERRFPGWIYPPVRVGDLIFTGGSSGSIWAINRHSGEINWSLPLGQELVYSPVVLADERIVSSTFGRELIALDRQGNTLWRHHYPTVLTQPLVMGNQLVFSGYDHSLVSIDASNGAIHWIRQLPERLSTELEQSDAAIVAVLESGDVWELSSETGEKLRTYRFPGEPIDILRLANGDRQGFIRSSNGPRLVKAIFNMSSKEK